ncbi:peptidoglycan-associated lipoprotein Pal [Ferrigenium sp. UT5]|uniref:peptidoglycan-associated lipoprotein Pal n=1 Tax=Ferrigenium sp. UT5 TaxID=3242105 RepID=UPI003550C3BB
MKKLILAIFLTHFLVACASNKPKEETAAPVTTPESSVSSAQTDAQAAAAAAQAATDAQAAAAAQAAADELAALKSKSSVYFPFDIDAVQAGDREIILMHARYLAAHPAVHVQVEGNADERGSSEYNLALGQRRAENTKRALVLGGADAMQIDSVSYGEEKPRCADHNEACWAQNRRADINYDAQ